MKEVKRILIGKSRPMFTEIYDPDFRGVYRCRCTRDLWTLETLRGHYEQGCFDEPVYKYVWEENGKIVESLTEPKEDVPPENQSASFICPKCGKPGLVSLLVDEDICTVCANRERGF